MTVFLKQARKELRGPLREAAEAARKCLADPELLERMNLIVSFWKIQAIKEQLASYDNRHTFGFGIPVKIGLRANDTAHFLFTVDIAEFKTASKENRQEFLLSFTASRNDIIWNNSPTRIPLEASLSIERIIDQLTKINHKELVNEACHLLFAEDFLRLTAGLHPKT